jgi:aspartate/methionine/tyrosine aminotransferase
MSILPSDISTEAMRKRHAFDGIRAQIRDLRTENIAVLAARARALGDVIPLWFGEGDVVTPPFIRDAAKAALDDGQTFYIPNMRGYGPLIEELSAYQSRIHGRPIPVERATIAPGGMQALYLALTLLVDVGTNVVYVAPQWPNIHNAIHLVGGEPRPVPLGFDTDWRLDLDRLFAACDARTRAIFLSTPSNPTGWTADREEMQALLDFSRRTGIWIISDEVYNRLYFDGMAAPSILEIAEDGDRVLAVNSFSKAWAMTGWRLGWLTHPSGVADQLAAMTQYANSGTPGFVQAGGAVALRDGEPLVAEIVDRIKAGLDLTYERLSEIPGIILPEKPRGGMYAFFALGDQPDARDACAMILEKSRVGLAPGHLFGASSGAFLRMCVFRDIAQIATALDRMVDALK